MMKSVELCASIEPEVKELPFEVRIPAVRPVNSSELSETELDAELEKGYADMASGKTRPAGQTFSDIRRDYGLGFMK